MKLIKSLPSEPLKDGEIDIGSSFANLYRNTEMAYERNILRILWLSLINPHRLSPISNELLVPGWRTFLFSLCRPPLIRIPKSARVGSKNLITQRKQTATVVAPFHFGVGDDDTL